MHCYCAFDEVGLGGEGVVVGGGVGGCCFEGLLGVSGGKEGRGECGGGPYRELDRSGLDQNRFPFGRR